MVDALEAGEAEVGGQSVALLNDDCALRCNRCSCLVGTLRGGDMVVGDADAVVRVRTHEGSVNTAGLVSGRVDHAVGSVELSGSEIARYGDRGPDRGLPGGRPSVAAIWMFIPFL